VAGAATVTDGVTVAEAVTMASAKSVTSLLTVTTLATVVGTAVDQISGYETTATSAGIKDIEISIRRIGAIHDVTRVIATPGAPQFSVMAAGGTNEIRGGDPQL